MFAMIVGNEQRTKIVLKYNVLTEKSVSRKVQAADSGYPS